MEIKPAQRVMKINRRQLEMAVIDYCGATDTAEIIFTVDPDSCRMEEVIIVDVVKEV